MELKVKQRERVKTEREIDKIERKKYDQIRDKKLVRKR